MESQESPDISQFTSTGENGNDTQHENEGPMEDGATGSWADDTPDPPEGIPIPDVLNNLINHGTRFKPVAQWSKTARPMLVKNLSVYFHVDTVVTSQAILEAFDAADIEIDFITSIQWRASNRTWVVSFDNQLAKETALEISSIEIGGTTVFLGDCENRLVLVKVFEAPAELPDTVVIGRLQHYGQVLSFRRDKIAQFIESGVRTARMRLHQHIPSVLNLAGEIVRIWYPNQPKSCRNCGSLDHLVRDCQSTRCFNCEKPGHRSEKCHEEPKCTCCRSEEHKLADCPYVKYSANVDYTPKDQTEEEKQEEKAKYKERVDREKKKREAAGKQQAQMQMAAKTTGEKVGEKKNDKGADNGKDNGKDNGQDNGADNGKDSGRDKGKGRDKQEDNGRRGEKRSRSGDRRGERSVEEKEKKDRRDYEAWKEERRRERERERDRDDRREREFSRSDRRDRSSRRDRDDYYSDDDDGWTEVSYRRGRRRDY